MIINFLDVDGEFLAKEIFHDLPVEQGYVLILNIHIAKLDLLYQYAMVLI